MMNTPHESFKDSLEHIWRNNKPLVYALVIIGIVGVYILYKRSQGSLVASGGTSTTPTTATHKVRPQVGRTESASCAQGTIFGALRAEFL